MALILNGDTIPTNATFTFAGQPVHKVDVCYNPNFYPVTVWMDAEPQGRIRMTWDNLVFPAVSCTYPSVADRCDCTFGGMRMKYCGDCAIVCWARCTYWTAQCLTGCMCIDCVTGIAGTCYTVNAYPTTTESFRSFGREANVKYCDDKTVNLTWSTGDGCSYTVETVGHGGDCRYYPRLHMGNYGAWTDMFCVGVPSLTVESNQSYSSSFTTCLEADLSMTATSSYGTRPVDLQKTDRTYPLSMTMCRSAIDLSSCFEYYYVSIGGNKVSDANGNAICFTRAQLTNGICVNFATAKLIN